VTRAPETATGPGGLLAELEWRGILQETTPGLPARLATGRPISGYIGFDPTADSLHVGHLVPIFGLIRLQRFGGKPVALVGGGTGMIGDPSGRSSERNLLDADTLAANVAAIRGQLGRFLDFDAGSNGAILVNNLDWLGRLSLVDFLRDTGKHFTIPYMLDKDSVQVRLSRGLSFTEFSYMLLQSYDFAHLHREYGVELQMGGADQWGNITAGLDLIRRMAGNQPHGPAHALTQVLLTKADGTKFGKTEGGAVWLDPEMTTPYAFYQFWLNADDRDIANFVRIFSFKSREEIEELERATEERPQARAAQRALAEELTTLVHGADQCAAVIAASKALFGQGELADLDERTLAAALSELPQAQVTELAPVADLLAAVELVPSKSAARRTIKEGGAYLNNAKVESEDAAPTAADLIHGRWLVLRRGKRNLGAVELTAG
jgi:tyrosyl-tRNA synthetase